MKQTTNHLILKITNTNILPAFIQFDKKIIIKMKKNKHQNIKKLMKINYQLNYLPFSINFIKCLIKIKKITVFHNTELLSIYAFWCYAVFNTQTLFKLIQQ